MSDSRVSKGDRVRRRATGEFGVVVDVEGDFAQIVFAQTGPATLHVDDVEPTAADSTLALRRGVEFEANWLNLTNHHCWAQR